MKKLLLLLCFSLVASLFFGQSNKSIDEILNADNPPFDQTALLVLQAANIVGQDATSQTALNYIEESGWFRASRLAKLKDGAKVTLGDVCLLLMRSFNLKGGISYSIKPTPYNSARELQFRNFFYFPDASPFQKVNGTTLITLLGSMMEYTQSMQKGDN